MLLVFSALAIGTALADAGVTVNFPSDNTYYCSHTQGCGYIGNNGGLSAHMRTAGDYITETFTTGQLWVNGGIAHFGIVDNFGGNPGAYYHNEVYINGVDVGGFKLYDCGYCDTLMTWNSNPGYWAPIVGNGVYTLKVVLQDSAAQGNGSEWFSVLTSDGSASTGTLFATPEPTSLILLSSGFVGLAGVLRRRRVLTPRQ